LLTLDIWRAKPEITSDWLLAPQDGFRFTARFYSPYTPLINCSYNIPGIMRPD